MIIWRAVPSVIIKRKIRHFTKKAKRTVRSFCEDHGDVPALRFNDVTKCFEAVVNTRGFAYAHRNALRFRKRKDHGN